jgi:hypothetical protein
MDFFGKIKKVFLTHKRKGTTMTATTTAQEQIDTLKGKINEFEVQLVALQKEILEKQEDAGTGLFEGRDIIGIENAIARLESRSKTIEFAKATATEKLAATIIELTAAKRIDAEARIKEIRKEVDQEASDLAEILKKGLGKAEAFEKLLTEAWALNNAGSVPLSPLGSWIQHANPYDTASKIDTILSAILTHLNECKPRN